MAGDAGQAGQARGAPAALAGDQVIGRRGARRRQRQHQGLDQPVGADGLGQVGQRLRLHADRGAGAGWG